MAGSIVVTASDLGRGVTKYAVAWTSDASGVVSANSFDMKSGRLLQSKFAPGTPAPTDLYDVTLLDASGADVLIGVGADRSATVANFSAPTNPVVIEGGAFTPVLANAGNAKQGTLTLYVLG